MATLDLEAKVSFTLSTDPKKLKFEDTLDYAAIGVGATQVTGYLQATGPSGIYYINSIYSGDPSPTPDIDLAISAINNLIELPIDGNTSEVLKGQHCFDYRVLIDNQILSHAVTFVNVGPKIFGIDGDETGLIDVAVGGTLTIIGSSANDGVYTIVSSLFDVPSNRTHVIVAEPIPDATPDGTLQFIADTQYDKQFCFDYCFDEETLPNGIIEMTSSCDQFFLKSRDATNYGDFFSLDRAHTLKYPDTVIPPLQDIAGNSIELIVPSDELWTGIYSSTIVSTVVYQETDGLCIEAIIQAANTHTLSCSDKMCCIYSCLAKLVLRWESMKNSGGPDEDRLRDKVFTVEAEWMLYSIAVSCGKDEEQKKHFANIKALLDSECDCSDCDDDGVSVKIVPLFSGINGDGTIIVIDTANNGITVTSLTVGNTTTYTLGLDQVYLNSQIATEVALQLGSYNGTFSGLTDTVVVAPQENWMVVYNSVGVLVAQSVGLNFMDDVDFTAVIPAVNQVLIRDAFLNFTSRLLLISDMGDVDTSGVAINEILAWNGANFVNIESKLLLDNIWLLFGQVGQPAFQNSWAHAAGSGEVNARWRKNGRNIEMQGHIDLGTSSLGWTMAINERPSAIERRNILVNKNGTRESGGYMEVLTDGGVYFRRLTGTLDGNTKMEFWISYLPLSETQ